MGNRADRSSGHEIDIDSTDELPVLDPPAYEASPATVGDKLGNTDTWITPPATGATDLASVFDTIRSLEANLRAKSEHTDDLEQQLARVERQLRVFEKDKAVLQSQIADLEDARDGLAADVEARGTTIARLKGDLATRAEQIRSIEQQRDAVEIDKVALTDAVRAREARIGNLESEVAARAGKLNELEGLALSHDQVGRRLKVSVGELERELEARASQLGARDERIAALETQLHQKEAARGEMAQALEQQTRRLAQLDHELAGAQQQTGRCVESLQNLEARRRYHDEALFAFEQEVDIHLQQIAHLEAQLSERAAEIATLQGAQRERDTVVDGLKGELQSRDTALGERATELVRLRAITHDSGGVIAELDGQIKSQAADIARGLRELGERDLLVDSLQEELRVRASELREREAEQAALRTTVDLLQNQLAKRDVAVNELVALLQVEQKRAAGLEADVAARARANAELEADVAARARANAELESRQRVQEEVAERQGRELDNWKEKWSEVAAAVGEKEARLAQAETEVRVNAAELSARAERINTLQKSVEDQAEALAGLERELRDKAESLGRFEGDLRVAEDSMLRLESQLRQKTDQQSGMQRSLDEQRGQIRHLQDTLATRDSAVARLEGELKASNEIIGNIQRDIRRLSGEPPAAKASPPKPEPPTVEPEPMTRLFVRLDDESEVVHVINKKTTSIGRTDDNDIAIDTRYISRHHARILTVPNATVIEDLGSTNGVFVNDQRVSRRQSLKDGDIVMVGKTRFRYAVKYPERAH